MPEDSQTPSSEPSPFIPPASDTPATPPASPASNTSEPSAVNATPYQTPAFSQNGFSQPFVSQPVVSSPQPAVTGSRAPKLKKPLVVSGLAIVAAVLIGGGFVFGFYLPNTPENVYSAGIENTGKALDSLVAYSKTQENVDYKSADFDGTLKVASPSASFDFDMNGSGDTDGNATATIGLDFLGNKGSANFRSVLAKGNTSPDVYLQVNGIKSYLDSNGLNSLDNLDGQWISIDHTLIDTYESQIKDMTPGGVSPDTAPTYAQIQDAETKVQAVNRQYLFSTNASTAVLTNEKYLGQTKEGGRILNHYTVGYNKEHLEAYAKAVAAALDSSQLNDWSKKANKGKNLSDVMDFSQLESDVMSAKGDYTFDLWVDTGTRLVSKVAFTDTDPADKGGTLTIGQGYTGGDEYPFSFAISDKDASGNPEQFTFNMSLNMKTNKVTLGLNGTTQDDTGKTTIALNLHATPSKQGITVTPPTGAKSVNDILNELGLGGLGSGGASSDTPLFFQQ